MFVICSVVDELGKATTVEDRQWIVLEFNRAALEEILIKQREMHAPLAEAHATARQAVYDWYRQLIIAMAEDDVTEVRRRLQTEPAVVAFYHDTIELSSQKLQLEATTPGGSRPNDLEAVQSFIQVLRDFVDEVRN